MARRTALHCSCCPSRPCTVFPYGLCTKHQTPLLCMYGTRVECLDVWDTALRHWPGIRRRWPTGGAAEGEHLLAAVAAAALMHAGGVVLIQPPPGSEVVLRGSDQEVCECLAMPGPAGAVTAVSALHFVLHIPYMC